MYYSLESKNDKKILRTILFSMEMQNDLNSTIHKDVESAAKNELLSNPGGPNMKVSPVSTGHGASRTDFKLTPI